MRWLSNYDGLERWVEEGKAPSIEVRDVLAVYVSEFGALAKLPGADLAALRRAITDELLQLEFLRYRAYWGRGLIHDADARVWQPLETPWLSFVDASRPGEELMVFFAAGGIDPPLEAHRRFLLQE